MLPKVNLLPMATVSYIMIVYLLATSNLSWYLWLFVGFVILERIFLGLLIWIETQIMKSMAKQMVSQMRQGDPLGGLGGPPDVP